MNSETVFTIISQAFLYLTYDGKYVDIDDTYYLEDDSKFIKRCCFFVKHYGCEEIIDISGDILEIIYSIMEMSNTRNITTIRWVYLISDNGETYIGPWAFDKEPEEENNEYDKLKEYAKKNGVISLESTQ